MMRFDRSGVPLLTHFFATDNRGEDLGGFRFNRPHRHACANIPEGAVLAMMPGRFLGAVDFPHGPKDCAWSIIVPPGVVWGIPEAVALELLAEGFDHA